MVFGIVSTDFTHDLRIAGILTNSRLWSMTHKTVAGLSKGIKRNRNLIFASIACKA